LIEQVRLGNPNGLPEVSVEGEIWTVEVGQPWRNERAVLKDGDLAPGVEIHAVGESSADPADRRLKAERHLLGGREYPLCPECDWRCSPGSRAAP
jgi:hypothetical protein